MKSKITPEYPHWPAAIRLVCLGTLNNYIGSYLKRYIYVRNVRRQKTQLALMLHLTWIRNEFRVFFSSRLAFITMT